MRNPTPSSTIHLWRSLEPSQMGFQDESSGIWLSLKHVNFTLVSLHPLLTQTCCSHPCLWFSKAAQAQGYSRVLLKDLLITKESYIIMQLLGNTTNGKWPNGIYNKSPLHTPSQETPCWLRLLRPPAHIHNVHHLSWVSDTELLKSLEFPEWWQKCLLSSIRAFVDPTRVYANEWLRMGPLESFWIEQNPSVKGLPRCH